MSEQTVKFKQLRCVKLGDVWGELFQQKLTHWRLDNPTTYLRGQLDSSALEAEFTGVIKTSDVRSTGGQKSSRGTSSTSDSPRRAQLDKAVATDVMGVRRPRARLPIVAILKNENLKKDWALEATTAANIVTAAAEMYSEVSHSAFAHEAHIATNGENCSDPLDSTSAWLGTTQVFIHSYIDLKTYCVSYRLGVPVLKPKSPFTFARHHRVSELLSPLQLQKIVEFMSDAIQSGGEKDLPIHNSIAVSGNFLAAFQPLSQEVRFLPLFSAEAGNLLRSTRGSEGTERAVVVVPDSSPPASMSPTLDPSADHLQPWSLRNVLFSLAMVHSLYDEDVSIMTAPCSLSPSSPSSHVTASSSPYFVHDITIPRKSDFPDKSAADRGLGCITSRECTVLGMLAYDARACNPNFITDLSGELDPDHQQEQQLDLNVHLIRWSEIPNFEPKKLFQLKILLLGSGTLGCSIARTMVGWGVRHFTFVDNGRVALSNPARQCLFTHQDAIEEEREEGWGTERGELTRPARAKGKFKAEAAASRLLEVNPRLTCTGTNLDIPMPGHSFYTLCEKTFEESHNKLYKLITEHDVVMLLLDSREARWLPALICSYMNHKAKTDPSSPSPLCMTVALGFSDFLVMRHAHSTAKVSCYFCNDFTSPTDSMSKRSFDQACTVTRAGLSSMAAGVACELIASLTQHPQGWGAEVNESGAVKPGKLGGVPHIVRGDLSSFSMRTHTDMPVPECICCSPQIAEAYRDDPKFCLKAIRDSEVLPEISGMTEKNRQAEEQMKRMTQVKEEEEDQVGSDTDAAGWALYE
eukprot:GHVN01032348.1.p1 GENE.GHVN01032348.1~~GHVN01032348.1.p1  ORF type:complete len:806 (+),score=120.54 GHVN01032348.1:66-2483(+)